MREILFRGRSMAQGSEWLYGDVILYENSAQIWETIEGRKHNSVVSIKTIGQYTGLTDKNGKRIFEGDIVDVEYDIQYVGVAAERIGLFVVVFDDGCFLKQKKDGGLFHFIPSDKCEVVGNIHDNPELLEVAK